MPGPVSWEALPEPIEPALDDRFGHAAFENGGGGGFRPGQGDFASAFSDVFDDLFGDFMGGQRGGGGRNRASRGSDLRYNLRLNLEESYHGKQATISVPGSAACEVCHGTEGAGDGPGAKDLDPQPRSLRDPKWQAEATDEKIASVSSFVSQTGEDAALRKQTYEESLGWYAGITADMFS